LPTPVDYSGQENQRDIYTLDQGDPVYRQRGFERSLHDRPQAKPQPVPPPPKTQHRPLPPLNDLPSSFYEANTESYLRARRVAEMKFNTVKLLLAYSLSVVVFISLDVVLDPTHWWCQWPIGFWGFIVLLPVIKSFLLRGRDLRAVIEARLHKMALREVERFDSDF
jgi:hypothetical protein